ncbi:MAG TPA: ferritin-like domain-containing protein [Pyrinomonadaceae bacterium]|nr:ferritin-like domain-containing protein [Pyrinomonadaceae bacterium]
MKSSGAKPVMEGNRTGIQTAPELAEEMIEGASIAMPSSEGGPEEAAELRAEYIAEGFPLGSKPGIAVSEEADADEEEAGLAVFMDKLGERLAFERMGTRLYEALYNKCETLGEAAPGPTLEDIQQIGSEELQHFLLLNRTIVEAGGDPTVQTPCADVAAVASLGIMQVLTDPRTSMAQSLQAILTAELTDNAGWELLIQLADNLGYEELSTQFQEALAHEEEHLVNVRSWLSECVMENAQV